VEHLPTFPIIPQPQSPQTTSRPRAIALVGLLAMLLGGASIVSLGSADLIPDPMWFRVRYGLVGIPLIAFIGTAMFQPPQLKQQTYFLLFWIWMCFGIAALLSGLINENSKALLDGVWLLIGVPFLFFYILPRAMGRSAESFLAWGLIIGHCPYAICSIIFASSTAFPYKGIFSNSNQLGATMMTLNCGLLILFNKILLDPPLRSSFFKIMGLIGALILSFGLILSSNSRTSLFGSLLGLFFALLPALQILKNPRNLARLLLAGLGTMLVFFIYLGTEFANLLQNIESGYAEKLESSDAFNGRSYVWGKTLEDARLFGYGSNDYFMQNFDLGGHNSIIDILGQNGLMAALLLIVFALFGVYYAYCYFREQVAVNPYAIAPLLISIMFWTVSMAESMFGALGRGLTVAYLISVGVMLYRPAPE
jgi:O-antigen ligase